MYPIAILHNIPTKWSYDAPILLNLTQTNGQNRHCHFKFEAIWLFSDSFFNLVEDIWSGFMKESYAYQLIRKTQLLKQVIKSWTKNQINNPNKEINILKQ